MSVRGFVAVLSLLLIVCTIPSGADPAHVRQRGESLEAYAKRIVPHGSEMAWKPMPLKGFGPAGSTLILYATHEHAEPLHGWLLYPRGAELARASLPPQRYPGWSLFEVKDVFLASVARRPLLFVRAEHVTGIGPTGAQPFSVTWVYQWDGKGLLARQNLIDRIGQQTARKSILARVGGKMR